MEPRLKLLVFFSLPLGVFPSMRDCGASEFRDVDGNCKLCKECGLGMEMSKDCGFGAGAGAQCVICRPKWYKDSWSQQKCKLCLSCVLVNRIQEKNCTVSSNAVCGKCLPGFYRKTRLGGFPDTECIPCTDPAPGEPQCISRASVARDLNSEAAPYDTALVAVLCSALTTILLAALLLCFIYCRKLIADKQNNGHPRPHATGRYRVESLCSEVQVDDASTEGLIMHCQKISAGKNAAQRAGPADVVPPEEAPWTLGSCFVAYLSPPGSQDQGRSTVTCPALSGPPSPEYRQGGSSGQQLLDHTSGGIDGSAGCPPVGTSSCGMDAGPLPGCGEGAGVSSGGGGICQTPALHCASVSRYRQQHAPMECTELDLQEYLTDVRCECAELAQETAARSLPSTTQEGRTTASRSFGSCSCIKGPCMRDQNENRPEECFSSADSNSRHHNLTTGNNWVGDVRDLPTKPVN
ncbi:tumor necrosis factor receptor superfamily member 27 isoform X2 [Scyliorhinus torazame]|uniref:tumor necrosis factor receptor superfamily member 27 isoform X2 n=1 Tax=Scyliorhinus torazame TaxID=75743 RepID=UPI003B59413A